MFIIKSQKSSLSLGKCYIWKDWPHRIRGCQFAVDKQHMYTGATENAGQENDGQENDGQKCNTQNALIDH